MIICGTKLRLSIRNCCVNLGRLAAKMTPEFSINISILLRENDGSVAMSL